MRRHAIAITAALLGAIWLAAIAIQLCFVAGLAGIPWLIGAIVAQIAAFLISGSLLLVTNTRRPYGIDPNAPPVRAADPFGQTSDELRSAAIVGGLPYGRRVHDDVAVVKRLIGKFEAEDAQRPAKGGTPPWALDLMKANGTVDIATELFPDPPPDDA